MLRASGLYGAKGEAQVALRDMWAESVLGLLSVVVAVDGVEVTTSELTPSRSCFWRTEVARRKGGWWSLLEVAVEVVAIWWLVLSSS